MSSTVLDSSAILAFLHREPGREIVKEHLADAIASAVNIAEVGAHLSDRGMPEAEIREAIESLGLGIAPFDEHLAYASAVLRPATRHLGLSLGDRACLSLARQTDAPALTGDRAWVELNIGVDVQLIRE